MKITFVRHGETEYNRTKRFQGQQQIPLNENGIAQAKEAAAELEGATFSHVYCSDLRRAIQTATIINTRSLPIIHDSRLNERNLGDWEDRSFTDVVAEHPEYPGDIPMGLWDVTPGNGESLQDLIDRSIDFIKELPSKHRESDNILVVTHGGPLRILTGYIRQIPPEDYMKQEIENCEIFTARYSDTTYVLEE